MSESNNHRDPFKDDPDNHETITSLVQRAVETHRQPQEESSRTRPRYPSEVGRVKRKITLDLDAETKTALRAVAKELGGVRTLSAVSQALIEYALEAYRSGRIEVRPCVKYGSVAFEAVDAEGNEK